VDGLSISYGSSPRLVLFLFVYLQNIGFRWSNYAWTFNTGHDPNTLTRSHRLTSIYVRFPINDSCNLDRLDIQRYLPTTATSTHEFQPTNHHNHALPRHSLQPALLHNFYPSPRRTSHIHGHRTPLVCGRVRRKYSPRLIVSHARKQYESEYSKQPSLTTLPHRPQSTPTTTPAPPLPPGHSQRAMLHPNPRRTSQSPTTPSRSTRPDGLWRSVTTTYHWKPESATSLRGC
jgi:hypothetical protein